MALPSNTCDREFRKFFEDDEGLVRVNVVDRRHPRPAKRVIGMLDPFEDSGAGQDMNVDGSVTPVEFFAGPTVSGETWLATGLIITMNDSGTQNFADFGALAGGLLNGLLVRADIDGSTLNIANIKNNAELISVFESIFRGMGNSFISDANFVAARTKFTEFIELNESTSDRYRILVRDDLTGLDLLRVRLTFLKILT